MAVTKDGEAEVNERQFQRYEKCPDLSHIISYNIIRKNILVFS